MVVKCVVLGCGVYSNDENIGFYSIPTVHKRTDVKTRTMMQQRRSEWLKVLMLKDPPPHVRVCGRHFVSGQPASLIDVHSKDWTPSLHLSNTRANQIAHQFDVPDRKKAKYADGESNGVSEIAPVASSSPSNSAGTPSLQFPPDSDPLNQEHFHQRSLEASSSQSVLKINNESTPIKCPSNVLRNIYEVRSNGATSCDVSASYVYMQDDQVGMPQKYNIFDSGMIGLEPFLDDDDFTDHILQMTDVLDATNDFSRCVPIKQLQNDDGQRILAKTNITNDNITLDDSGYSAYQGELSSTKPSFSSDICVQTDECLEKETRQLQTALTQNESKLQKALDQVAKLQRELANKRETTRLTVTALAEDDKKCKYFTGVKSGHVMKMLFDALGDDVPVFSELTREESFVMTLRKLRLNEPFCTLAYLYDIQPSVISNYFYETIDGIYHFMRGLVRFPSRNVLHQHMPIAFKKKYKETVTVIIDCFEIPMENPNPKAMQANANVYSNYKKHKTIKVLIGISASGNIIYVSEAFGGRTSDKEIVKKSGFLDEIQEGDFVMADRGFLIDELLTPLGASVAYPAFKKKNHQLEPLDAVESKELSSLRIHVERVIGSLRQKFLILTNDIPITLIQRWNNETPAIDQILVVAAGLVNLCPSVVGP